MTLWGGRLAASWIPALGAERFSALRPAAGAAGYAGRHGLGGALARAGLLSR